MLLDQRHLETSLAETARAHLAGRSRADHDDVDLAHPASLQAATVAAVDVTDATFEQDVVERSRELPVVVDFWAEWCGPCKLLEPVLEKAAAARDGELVLAKLDVDANPAAASRFGVRGIPAVKAFRHGHVVDGFVGAQPPSTWRPSSTA